MLKHGKGPSRSCQCAPALPKYESVLVSTLITWPAWMKSGTWTVAPLSSVAGLVLPPGRRARLGCDEQGGQAGGTWWSSGQPHVACTSQGQEKGESLLGPGGATPRRCQFTHQRRCFLSRRGWSTPRAAPPSPAGPRRSPAAQRTCVCGAVACAPRRCIVAPPPGSSDAGQACPCMLPCAAGPPPLRIRARLAFPFQSSTVAGQPSMRYLHQCGFFSSRISS